MKLENQVTSLEISKRLKELGEKQESLFHWTQYWGPDSYSQEITKGDWHLIYGTRGYVYTTSAFTVAELGEMLPLQVENKYVLNTFKQMNGWACRYGFDAEIQHLHQSTEADARGKMLIYLLENKLVTP